MAISRTTDWVTTTDDSTVTTKLVLIQPEARELPKFDMDAWELRQNERIRKNQILMNQVYLGEHDSI